MVGIVAFLASIGFLVGEWYDNHFFYFIHSFLKNLVKLLRDNFLILAFLASIGFLVGVWHAIFFIHSFFNKISWNCCETIFILHTIFFHWSLIYKNSQNLSETISYFPNIYSFLHWSRRFKQDWLFAEIFDQFLFHP